MIIIINNYLIKKKVFTESVKLAIGMKAKSSSIFCMCFNRPGKAINEQAN